VTALVVVALATVGLADGTARAGGAELPFRFAFANRLDQGLMPQYGYNLIDVATKNEADAVPAGTLAQVWLGNYDNTACSWKVDDATLSARVAAMADDPKVAGFYFSADANPVKCADAIQQHKDRDALIKSAAPSKYTLVSIDANSGDQFAAQVPLWQGVADYLAYNPYICHVGKDCDYAWLDTVLDAAESNGTPYFIALQAFADGSRYRWPSGDEERQMLARLSDPKLTRLRGYMTFSWNYNNDPLRNHPDVLQAIKDFNLSGSSTPTDTTPPTAPGDPTVTATTTTSISIAWTASSDNAAVSGYDLLQNGNNVGTTTNTSHTFTNLTCGTTYTLALDAYDTAGNHSPQTTITAATDVCPAPPPTDPVVAAAGDICATATDCAGTAKLIDAIDPTRVLALGDNAYQDGRIDQYNAYYDPNWGRFKAKTSPVPGNHDYHTSGAGGYFTYFGSQAPAEYYSYDLGSWHLIALDGEIGHGAGSAQETWLKNDLANHPGTCTLAYWHEPRFSSGYHGSNSGFDAFWHDLYAAGVDVVLNGHDHDYERFAPQNASGAADANGIREFVVGTGGASHYTFGAPIANSEVRNNTSYGVLKLTLHSGSYDWQFVPAAGASFTDSGSSACH
jgi:hypothetical protein